jgi:hypothetical protein
VTILRTHKISPHAYFSFPKIEKLKSSAVRKKEPIPVTIKHSQEKISVIKALAAEDFRGRLLQAPVGSQERV